MAEAQWMVRGKDGAANGPWSTEGLRAEIEAGRLSRTAMVSLDGAPYRPVIEWPQLQGIRFKTPFRWRPLAVGACALLFGLAVFETVSWYLNRPPPAVRDTTFDALRALAETWPDNKRKGTLAAAREAYDKGEFAECEANAAGAMAEAPDAQTAAFFAECAAVASRSGLQSYRERLLQALPEQLDVERAALLVSLRRNGEALPLALSAFTRDPARRRTRLVLARLAIDGAQTPENAQALLAPLQPQVEAFLLLQQWALASGELFAPFTVEGVPEERLLAYAGRVCRLDAVAEAANARFKPVALALVGKRPDDAKRALGDKEDTLPWQVFSALIAHAQQREVPEIYEPLAGFLAALAPHKKTKLESVRREELLAVLDGIAAPNPCAIPFLEDVLASFAVDDPLLLELVSAWRAQKAKRRLPGFEGTLVAAVGLFVQHDYRRTVALLERPSRDEEAPRAMLALLGRAIERTEPAVSDDYWSKLVERDDDFTSLLELHEARLLTLSGHDDEARERLRTIYLNDKAHAPLEVLRVLASPKPEKK